MDAEGFNFSARSRALVLCLKGERGEGKEQEGKMEMIWQLMNL